MFTWGFARRSTPGCHMIGLSALTLRAFGPAHWFAEREFELLRCERLAYKIRGFVGAAGAFVL